MKRALIFIMGLIFGAYICMGAVLASEREKPVQTAEEYKEEIIALSAAESEAVREQFEVYEQERKEREPKSVEVLEDYQNEILFLAKCVEAEAGNQDYLGKRLVVDVILNRVDSDKFPNTIEEVIKQENQFSVWANGSLERAEPSESTWDAVYKELQGRTDDLILYFRAGDFHSFGTRAYRHGDHFFSY